MRGLPGTPATAVTRPPAIAGPRLRNFRCAKTSLGGSGACLVPVACAARAAGATQLTASATAAALSRKDCRVIIGSQRGPRAATRGALHRRADGTDAQPGTQPFPGWRAREATTHRTGRTVGRNRPTLMPRPARDALDLRGASQRVSSRESRRTRKQNMSLIRGFVDRVLLICAVVAGGLVPGF